MTPPQTELEKAIETPRTDAVKFSIAIHDFGKFKRYQGVVTVETSEQLERELCLAARRISELEQRVKEVEKERDELKTLDLSAQNLIETARAQRDESQKDLSTLRIEYKKVLDALNDEISSLVCVFVISQHLPPCDSYNNPEENWCGVCKRRKRVNIIRSSSSAIAAMKGEV